MGARCVCKRCARVTNRKAQSHRVHTFKLVKAFIKGGSTGSSDTAEGVKKRTFRKTTAEACELPAGCLHPLLCASREAFVECVLCSESAYVPGS